MRMSRVLLAGVAVAGVAVTTSAFTASNDLETSVAGFGQAEVTGADVTDIHYVVNATDGTVVDAVEFLTITDVTGAEATLTLKSGATAGVGGTAFATYACTTKAGEAWDGTDMTLTCDTTNPATTFEDFNAVGLTVVS
jgi:hypothetical protein